jgi:hypothetical protein
VLRKIQAAAVKGNLMVARAKVPLEAANYLLNEKRDRLLKIEQEYSIRIHVEGDATLTGSIFNLSLDKKDISAIEAELLEAEAKAFEEADVFETELAEEEPVADEEPAAAESALSEAFEESAPLIPEAVASIVEASLSAEVHGSVTVEEPATIGNGSPLQHPVPIQIEPSARRRLRFWWLRCLGPSTGRSMREPLQPDVVGTAAADAEASPDVRLTPTFRPDAHRTREDPRRPPDAEAPWRRMLPPIRPPLQLPRRGADDEGTGDHPSL